MTREAQYKFDRGIVGFGVQDGNRRVRGAISREALENHLGGDHRDKVEAFQAHRQEIEERVRRKYLVETRNMTARS